MSNNKLDFPEFMHALMSAPFEPDKCSDCGGLGLELLGCCSGRECGCMGMTVDYKVCGCGIKPITEDELLKINKAADGQIDGYEGSKKGYR